MSESRACTVRGKVHLAPSDVLMNQLHERLRNQSKESAKAEGVATDAAEIANQAAAAT